MRNFWLSAGTAVFIALAIQSFTIGVVAQKLPREVLRPGVEQSRTLSYPAAKRVRLHNADGGVQINTHEASDILIIANVRAYTASSAVTTVAEQYVSTLLDITASSDLLDIVTEPATRPVEVEEMRVDFSITVPLGTHISIDGANGNVLVGPGCGRLEVDANNADITLQGTRDTIRARSINGRIRLEQGLADARLETVNGSIIASMSAGSLQATTTNGAILASLLGDSVGSCDLTSLNGDITLALTLGCSAEIQAASERGAVRPDLAMVLDPGVQLRKMFRATLGDGKMKIAMNSVNGDIAITRSST
jgi:DUF4097 and DUF4098 domain-containing protein YvlB